MSWNFTNRFISWLICGAWLLATTPFHHHDADIHLHHHDANQVFDSCHYEIYHGIASNDCANHSHLYEDEGNCLICHFYKTPQQFTFKSKAIGYHLFLPFKHFIKPAEYFNRFCKTTKSPRAPPLCV